MTLIVKGIFIDCVDSEVNKKQQLENRLNCGGGYWYASSTKT